MLKIEKWPAFSFLQMLQQQVQRTCRVRVARRTPQSEFEFRESLLSIDWRIRLDVQQLLYPQV